MIICMRFRILIAACLIVSILAGCQADSGLSVSTEVSEPVEQESAVSSDTNTISEEIGELDMTSPESSFPLWEEIVPSNRAYHAPRYSDYSVIGEEDFSRPDWKEEALHLSAESDPKLPKDGTAWTRCFGSALYDDFDGDGKPDGVVVIMCNPIYEDGMKGINDHYHIYYFSSRGGDPVLVEGDGSGFRIYICFAWRYGIWRFSSLRCFCTLLIHVNTRNHLPRGR